MEEGQGGRWRKLGFDIFFKMEINLFACEEIFYKLSNHKNK